MEYKNPATSIDMIIESEGKILVIVRNKKPFKGMLALPGGHVEYEERIEDTLVREMEEEIGLIVKPKEILGVYSDKDRDPRKHTITTCFICDIVSGEIRSSDETKEIKWINLNELVNKKLAFDHSKIIKDYIKWKENKGTYWSTKGP